MIYTIMHICVTVGQYSDIIAYRDNFLSVTVINIEKIFIILILPAQYYC